MMLAQNPATTTPLVLQIPEMESVTVRSKNVYRTVNSDTSLTFDLFLPKRLNAGQKVPIVLFINGVGSMDIPQWRGYRDWGRFVAANGMAGIVYQSRHPQFGDTDALITFVRSHASEFGLDPERIAIWCSSANVTVGLPIILQSDRTYIRAGVVYYGMPGQEALRKPTRQDVPMLVVRNGFDSYQLNRNIDQFIASALEYDMDIEVINYLESKHAFDIFDDTDRSRSIIRRTAEFLNRNLHTPNNKHSSLLTPSSLYRTIVAEKRTEEGLTLFENAVTVRRRDSLFNAVYRYYDHVIDEQNLNLIGYRLMDAKRMDEAFRVFSENARHYPASPNAFDGMADYYERRGDSLLSVQNAAKALELLKTAAIPPQFKEGIRNSAEDKMRRLKNK
jgi:tetratricopeptide (TPR) repeat protein